LNNNILTVVFGPSRTGQTRKAYQYDYGMVLRFPELNLPVAYEVHFANKETGVDSVTQIGGTDGVSVPDAMFVSGEPVHVWVYLHTGEDDGETVYKAVIPVVKRARPSDATPDPVQQSEIDQAIAALNAAVEQTSADAESASESATAASNSASAALTSEQNASASASAAAGSASAALASQDEAAQSATAAATSESAASASATSAYNDAERAEQAAATAGYLDVEIVDGDLIYTRTDAVDVDFELVEGNLVMEAV
jgi:hypothetical protein